MDRATRNSVIPYIKESLAHGFTYFDVASKLNQAGHYPKPGYLWDAKKLAAFAKFWGIVKTKSVSHPELVEAAGTQLELTTSKSAVIDIKGTTNKEAAEAVGVDAGEGDRTAKLVFKLVHAENITDSEMRMLLKKVLA